MALTFLGRFKAILKVGTTSIYSYVYVIEGQTESLHGRKNCFDVKIPQQEKFVKQTESDCKKINDPKQNS